MPSIAREFPSIPTFSGGRRQPAVDVPASPRCWPRLRRTGRSLTARSSWAGSMSARARAAPRVQSRRHRRHFRAQPAWRAHWRVRLSCRRLRQPSASVTDGRNLSADSSLPPAPTGRRRAGVLRWAARRGQCFRSHPIGVLGAVSFGAGNRSGVPSSTASTHDGAGRWRARQKLAPAAPREFRCRRGESGARHVAGGRVDGSLALKVGAPWLRHQLMRDGAARADPRSGVNRRQPRATLASPRAAATADDRPGKCRCGVKTVRPGCTSSETRNRFRAEPHHRRHRLGSLPDRFDGFVETVFGVHGPPGAEGPPIIEEDRPGERSRRQHCQLSNKTALDLLRHAAGLMPRPFDEAKGIVPTR